MSKSLEDLESVEPRLSEYTIDYLRTKLSSVRKEDNYFSQEARFQIEMVLCLANEILFENQKLHILKIK